MKPVLLAFCCLLPLTGGSIEGRVTNAATGDAVARVKVQFHLQNQRYTAETDENGEYRIADLKEGSYEGWFTRNGFANQPVNRLVVAGDTPVRCDAQLTPWGGVRGRVIGEDGKPAANVRVEISQQLESETATDENGEFALSGLAPGIYTIVAKPEDKIKVEEGVRLGTTPIFYPSVTEPEDAVPIAVHNGAETTGIVIRLKPVPVQRLAGVILDDAGKPVARAVVKLLGHPGRALQYPSNGGGSIRIDRPAAEPELAHVESGEDGAFEFSAVRQGDWRLSVETALDDERSLAAVVPAKIGDKDLDGLQIRLAPPSSVQVTVDFGRADVPPFAQRPSETISLGAVEGQPDLAHQIKDADRINGVFSGRYRVMPRLLNSARTGWYVAAILLDGRDVRGQAVELAPGASLRAVFKQGAGKLRGTADKGEGATVFLVPRQAAEVVLYQEASCGPNGAFEFDGVEPGDYYVVAFDHAGDSGLPPGSLPTAIAPMAASVRVEPGAAASVELRVSPWPW